MKTPVHYCHACLSEMGLERNGIRNRKRTVAITSLDGACPCCKREATLFSIRDYQRIRNLAQKKRRVRKPTTPKPVFVPKPWPEGLSFEGR